MRLRSLVAIWALSATFFFVVLLFGKPPPGGRTILLCVDVIGFTVLGLLLVGRDRLPGWTTDLCAYLFYLAVGAIIFAHRDPNSAVAFFYLWLSVHSFYFLPWRRAAPQVAFIAVDYAVALGAVGASGFPALRYAITIVTTVVICTFVGLLRNRVDALVTRLAGAARTDPLTGLRNRRAYEEVIDLEMARSDRTNDPLALVVGDLDHFKRINDRLGHPTGDAVLQRVAAHLETGTRRVDTVVRLGGEEFALLLPHTDAASAYLVAERIRESLRRSFASHPIPVTISFGIASYPDSGVDALGLFEAADTALRKAKAQGRDRSVLYSGPVLSGPAEVGGAQQFRASHQRGGRPLEDASSRD